METYLLCAILHNYTVPVVCTIIKDDSGITVTWYVQIPDI
jgi:hypothetical protein